MFASLVDDARIRGKIVVDSALVVARACVHRAKELWGHKTTLKTDA
jgi:hypothetical protein